MAETYTVIFRGDILPGHTLTDVKGRMGQLFKLEDARVAALFSGKPVALKKNCDAATAEKLRAVLTKAGAEVEVRPDQAVTTAPAAATTREQVRAGPQVPAPPPSAVASEKRSPAPAQVDPPPRTAEPSAGSLQLAPVGQVLSEQERAALRPTPVQVATDHIALEKRASVFGVTDDQPVAPERPEITAPDFEIFKAGADLLKQEEKRVFEQRDFDLSSMNLAEVGADLLAEDERASLPVMEVGELDAELAPAGSDMGQLKKEAPPPPPNTDHISLS